MEKIRILKRGAELKAARAAVIMIHGRGATAEDILSLSADLTVPEITFLAPQAKDFSWYPYSFLAPIEMNQPHLSRSLNVIADMVDALNETGITSNRLVLLGFSQGACLSVEWAARNPQRFGGIVAFSGGLIGPPGDTLEHPGSLEGTPVFLGSANPDPYIPSDRVIDTGRILEGMGAQVTLKIYPDLGHTINTEELGFARQIIEEAAGLR